MEQKPRRERVLAAVLAVAVFLFIITVSIGLPIYIRPFYYLHIEALNLSEVSGFAADRIIEAYNEVLDYLTLPGKTFGTGTLAITENAADHFRDCKVLFDLNAGLLLGSTAVLLILLVLRRTGRIGELKLGSYGGGFWGALGAVGMPLLLGSLAALDFDRAFVIFHSIFFPGKDNWLFDWNKDQIIRVLPQQFFMNCAILIGVSVFVLSLIVLVVEYRKKNNKESIHGH